MRIAGIVLGVVGTVALHGGFLAFGGILFPKGEETASTREVELLSEAEAEEEKPKDEPEKTEETIDELEAEEEEAPDVAELLRSLDLSPVANAPALEEASLGAIAQALSGLGAGGGDFAGALSFASGGRIGGLGTAGALDGELSQAFSMAEIDQKPRAVFQAAPLYPSDMRGKKVEGLVTILFVVDPSGRVVDPRVEKSSHPAFEKPALEAVRQWKFEPAIKGGERVRCKMRVPIRFQSS